MKLIFKTRILGTPEHSDPVGLIKQRRRLFEKGKLASRGGCRTELNRAGQTHGHASGEVTRLLYGRMTGARSHAPMECSSHIIGVSKAGTSEDGGMQ